MNLNNFETRKRIRNESLKKDEDELKELTKKIYIQKQWIHDPYRILIDEILGDIHIKYIIDLFIEYTGHQFCSNHLKPFFGSCCLYCNPVQIHILHGEFSKDCC